MTVLTFQVVIIHPALQTSSKRSLVSLLVASSKSRTCGELRDKVTTSSGPGSLYLDCKNRCRSSRGFRVLGPTSSTGSIFFSLSRGLSEERTNLCSCNMNGRFMLIWGLETITMTTIRRERERYGNIQKVSGEREGGGSRWGGRKERGERHNDIGHKVGASNRNNTATTQEQVPHCLDPHHTFWCSEFPEFDLFVVDSSLSDWSKEVHMTHEYVRMEEFH